MKNGQMLYKTDNGKVFNITLDPGLCFAMSLDWAKCLLQFPDKVPYIDQLTPGKWAIVQSAYEINNFSNDRKIIEAQTLEIDDDGQGNYSSWDALAEVLWGLSGTVVWSIGKAGNGAHAMGFHKTSSIYVLDPNFGCYQFDDNKDDFKAGLSDHLLNTYSAGDMDLREWYDYFTVKLA
jgi:hypothetical protein